MAEPTRSLGVDAQRGVVPILPVRDRPSPLRRLAQDLRRDRATTVGITIIAVIAIGALLAPLLPIADPNATDPALRLASPGQHGFVLGSDQLGRDILSRVIWGARVSLVVGFVSAGIALTWAVLIVLAVWNIVAFLRPALA